MVAVGMVFISESKTGAIDWFLRKYSSRLIYPSTKTQVRILYDPLNQNTVSKMKKVIYKSDEIHRNT